MYLPVSGRSRLFAVSFSTNTTKKCLNTLLLSLENAVSAEISTAGTAKQHVGDCCFLLVCTSAHAHMFLGDVKP